MHVISKTYGKWNNKIDGAYSVDSLKYKQTQT